ncbi:hypothetical protein O7602_28700 [Micromonospora sp. WMMD1128]|uniref:hypothetical protein n=1 Tax=unclassified Micromonospora TaxID=2617518 RepID=UPI00248CBC45|nr:MULTISPECIES: hypothetical protein [unclassified Micromonospora]WBB73599.1 hypothetical protein O7602_28700 [Micromonospora sp. WMMD1128]WFE33008.1 hypothetical protein O7613_26270 [Micromonospora sp. WMMD975]
MPDQQVHIGRQLQRKQFRHLLRQLGTRILDLLQPVIVFGGLIIILVLNIPWMKPVLDRVDLKDTSGLTQTLIFATLGAVFLEVRSIAQRVEDNSSEQKHLADPLDVYAILIDRIRSIKRPEEKCLDVLGMSLYTAWPSIGFWLNRTELQDWKIRMAAVVESDAGGLFPTEWVDEGRNNLTQIYDMQQSPALARRRITLEPYGYNFVPVVHGFRLGNGDLFYSLLGWGPDGRISRDKYSYEYLPSEDRSPSAESIRDVFDSWFVRACRDRWPRPS